MFDRLFKTLEIISLPSYVYIHTIEEANEVLYMESNVTEKQYVRPSKEDFCEFCRILYERHLVAGVGGNLSVRAGDNILLTPSGYSLREIMPDMVVSIDETGKILEGHRPTKDAEMHLRALNARPEANVVCHIHGASIIAASSLLAPGPASLPPVTPGFVYYAHPLPMLPFRVPGTKELATMVETELAGINTHAVLLQNHGLVTVGRDFSEALNVAEEIDEAAQVFLLTKGKGKPIPEEDIEKIKGF
jgi:ribulose-5-phosphate 4-epimerase/fuculose-1-phosphate aldolase